MARTADGRRQTAEGRRPLTAKELRELNARRAAEYHALQSQDERTAYVLRHINDEFQERYFTGDGEGEERALDVDLDKRIVRGVSFASDEPYLRWFGWEILDHSTGAPNFKRLNNGGAFLKEHWGDQLGVVVKKSAKIDGNKSRCDLFFSQRDEAKAELQDIADGIRCNTSLRYTIDDIRWEGADEQTQEDIYRVTKWTPIHVASVSDPADFSVGFGKSLSTPNNQIQPEETRACVEGDPACTDESCPVHYEDAEEAKSKELSASPKKRARKSMALRKLKAKPAACKEGDPECNNEKCTVHFEDAETDEPERSAEEIEAQKLVSYAKVFGEEQLALDYAAQGKTLVDLRAEIAKRRKERSDKSTPANEDPNAVAARNGGEPGKIIQFPYATRPRHFKGATTQEAATKAYRMGMWFRAALFNDKKAVEFCEKNGIALVRATQQEGVNETGGFLVPPEFGNDMIDLREEYGVVRRLFKVVPMASDTRSDPRRTGGLTAYFVGESDAGTQSNKSWDRVTLTARKLMCLARISSELNEDSIVSLGDDLAGEMAYAFANKEDDCGINGDGTSTYGSITGLRQAFKNLSGTIANIAGLRVATGTGYATSYGSIVLADFHNVKSRLPQYALRRGPRWVMHQSFWSDVVERLVLAAGGVTAMEIAAGMPPRLLGYPVEISQVMPSVSAVSQVVAFFGVYDLAASFGDRRSTTIALSEHSRFANDEIEIRGTERFDINVHDVGNASATPALRVPGPVVGLITAAS